MIAAEPAISIDEDAIDRLINLESKFRERVARFNRATQEWLDSSASELPYAYATALCRIGQATELEAMGADLSGTIEKLQKIARQ